MKVQKVTKMLLKKYPRKRIIKNPQDNPTEILCEIDPFSDHPEYSDVLAVIDKSAVHYHKKTIETYAVINGELNLFINGKRKRMKKGEQCQVTPYAIHWAEGNETWVTVHSVPGWTPEDHILLWKEEQIHIVPYDPLWISKFEKEKKLIEKTLGSRIKGGVHHVGSTAVPGLAAKPIIDIMVGVKNLKQAEACIPLLAKIHYVHFPYKPHQMIWFCKPSPKNRTHHLYLMKPSHPQWKARLTFRDYLRSNSDEAKLYEKLKVSLSQKYRDDREAYTNAKTEFINKTLKKALYSGRKE